MTEIWKDIEGYEGLYQVSNLGRVKSLNYNKTRKEKILSCGDKNGYLFVVLCKNGKHKQFQVHRLVAQEFVPNPENKPYVDHINTIKNDNRVENIRWCTHKENCNNEISRENQSRSHKGKTPWNKGVSMSEEYKQKLSKVHKGKTSPNKGKHWKLENGKRVWY